MSSTFVLTYSGTPVLTIFGITINNRLPRKSYSKLYGAEPRYNSLRYNDIAGLTIGISLTERKIFPVITMKSISLTIGSANIVNIVQ